MYIWRCDRGDLTAYLSGSIQTDGMDLVAASDISEVKALHGEMILVWKNRPFSGYLPNAIIVHDGSVGECYAWLRTYFRKIRPFSAHCRVLSHSASLKASEALPEIRERGPLYFVGLGMTIAEGISYSMGQGRTSFDRIGYSTLSRTLSFCVTAYLNKYNGGNDLYRDLAELCDRWELARMAAGQPLLSPNGSMIFSIWRKIIGAFEYDPTSHSEPLDYANTMIRSCLLKLKSNHKQFESEYVYLQKMINLEVSLELLMSGPIEGRVKASMVVISKLTEKNIGDPAVGSFFAGFIASRISTGGFDHLPVLLPVVHILPECIFWFGVCSGLSSRVALDGFGDGVGAMIGREMERDSHWLNRPIGDISYDELEVLMRGGDGIRNSIKTINNGVILVELMPMIYSTIKWSDLSDDKIVRNENESERQLSLLDDQRNDIIFREILSKIEDSIESIEVLRRRVRGFVGDTYNSRKRKK